ncbi:hypothetical protein ABZ801_26930 [Actinomadura sp. NPDC047616]|uniref:hypothetical protein n=1 Tax=Actinomadura sp. NPDC047616 TaxID=3155914 RepID=UPI0034035AEF
MISERKAERWVLRSASGTGFRARRAARRLFAAADGDDLVARAAVARIAAGPEHPHQREARHLVAEWWATGRAPDLRDVVLRTGAVAREGPAMLRSAALVNRLQDFWSPEHAGFSAALVTDDDADVAAAMAVLCRTADGPALEALWRHAPHCSRLRSALLANPTAPGETVMRDLWARRLDRPDPQLVAALSRWPIPPAAKMLIGERWAAARTPELRRLVLETGATAGHGLARLQTLALLDRLDDGWKPGEARLANWLLIDEDPELRERAERFCRTADGPMLQALWAAANTRGPLRSLLMTNPSPPPAMTLNALWQAWLKKPDERLWDALARWRVPATSGRAELLSTIAVASDPQTLAGPRLRQALVEAASLREHPLGAIARAKIVDVRDQELVDALCEAALSDGDLVSFCRENRFAPKDPVRRVVFFLLTDQPEQYHGMDPDGGLLALAYTSASPELRTRIQHAMLAAGELDLVRVIVGDDRRARIQNMTEEETRYLAEQLAARNEWADLWAVVQDLPLDVGVPLMRLFDRWAPRDEDSRRIFMMYRRTEPQLVRRAFGAMRSRWPVAVRQATIQFHGRVNDISFAPDAPLLAVAGSSRVAGVIDLSRARLIERYDGFRSSVGRVLHVGNGAFVAGERTNGPDRVCRIVRCAHGDRHTLHETRGSVTSLALTSDEGAFAAGTRSGHLVMGAPSAGPVTAQPVTRLGLREDDWPRSLAAHRPSGRLAVLGRRLVLAGATAQQVLARGTTGQVIVRAEFTDEDTLVCVGNTGVVRQLHRRAGSLHEKARTSVDAAGPLGGLGSTPELDRVIVADRRGALHFLEARTLKTGRKYSSRRREPATSMNLSPSGEFLAVGYGSGSTDLYDLRIGQVPEIARQPLVNLVPRHLGVIGGALASPDLQEGPKELLTLLHACLEHRFRFDIEIGDAVTLSAGEYDISL